MTVAPATTSWSARRVDSVLGEFLDRKQQEWPDPDLRPMLDALRRFILNGGKRLRPSFCYWAWHGLRSGDDAAVIAAGAAIEMFHCFALIHDDIIDASGLRRGKPALHEHFAARHARLGWRGDPHQSGRNVALLCGDLCALWAEELLAGCGAEPERLHQAQLLFATMRAEAIAGEYLDVAAQAANGRNFGPAAIQRALRIVRLKTARYSIVRPLQIGAVLAGADAAVLEAFSAFGEPLGEAFQLRDDILGVFGDPALTGKSVLDDLRQAKPTLLLATTLTNVDRRERTELTSLVGDPELGPEGAKRVRHLMVACGALEATEERIARGHAAALAALVDMNIGAEAKQALVRLADFATTRNN